MKKQISAVLDEDKLRASKKDFGLVTVSAKDYKGSELFLEEIPRGMLLPYIMASASFPGFQPEEIDGIAYLDGGLSNKCPINMLLQKGYDEIIAVRTKGPGRFRAIPKNKAKITLIDPSKDLGHVMVFDHDLIMTNIQMGYYDALRTIDGLRGTTYYITPADEIDFGQYWMSMSEDDITAIGDAAGMSNVPPKRMLFEQIIPTAATHLGLGKGFDYQDFSVGLLEYAATKRDLPIYRIYDFPTLHSAIQETAPQNEPSAIAALLPSIFNKGATCVNMLLKKLLQSPPVT